MVFNKLTNIFNKNYEDEEVEEGTLKKNEIFTLWINNGEDSLPELAVLSLKSMILTGHDVILYTYANLKNIPKGVKVADANNIIPESDIYKYKNDENYSAFTNMFRLKRLYEYGGTWLDLDIVLIRNINEIITTDIAICTQPDDKYYNHPNNNFIRFPSKNPFIKDMLDYATKRGKDARPGETGYKLILRLLQTKYINYNKYLKPFNLINTLNNYKVSGYLEETQYILHNVDMDEVLGFHFFNEEFSKQGLNDQYYGLYKDLKEAITSSKKSRNYYSKLKTLKIRKDYQNDRIKYWDIKYLKMLDKIEKPALYSFIIDSTKITKSDLYTLLHSIEKTAGNKSEIIICGKTNIAIDDIPFNNNLIILNSKYQEISDEVINFTHGKYIIPIDKPIIFKEKFFKYLKNVNISLHITFPDDTGNENSLYFIIKDDLKNEKIFKLSSEDLKELKCHDINTNLIYAFNYKLTNELILMEIVDNLYKGDVGDNEFNKFKSDIVLYYDNTMNNKISYYYYSACKNMLKSYDYQDFVFRCKIDSLNAIADRYLQSIDYYR